MKSRSDIETRMRGAYWITVFLLMAEDFRRFCAGRRCWCSHKPRRLEYHK